MTPIVLLISCLALTAVAFAIDVAGDARRRAMLRRLAAQRDMHFAAGDRFNLARRVWAAFPVMGAASPKVADVIYGRRDDRYHYVFRFDYTVGGTSRPQRRRAIVSFSEPRDRATAGEGASVSASATEPLKLSIADGHLPLVEQYQTALPLPESTHVSASATSTS